MSQFKPIARKELFKPMKIPCYIVVFNQSGGGTSRHFRVVVWWACLWKRLFVWFEVQAARSCCRRWVFSLLWSLLNCKEFHRLRIYSGQETNSTSVLYSGWETNRTSVFATDLNQRVQQSIEPACSSLKLKLQSTSVPLQNSFATMSFCYRCCI